MPCHRSYAPAGCRRRAAGESARCGRHVFSLIWWWVHSCSGLARQYEHNTAADIEHTASRALSPGFVIIAHVRSQARRLRAARQVVLRARQSRGRRPRAPGPACARGGRECLADVCRRARGAALPAASSAVAGVEADKQPRVCIPPSNSWRAPGRASRLELTPAFQTPVFLRHRAELHSRA